MTLPADARLDRLIERGELSGGFFLHGDAGRLRDAGLRRLVDAALEPATRDFNLSYYRGGEAAPEDVAAALAMPPMLAPRRVVVLTEAERLSPSARKVVVAALERLPDDVLFVISATVPASSRAVFYATLEKRCVNLEWRQLRADEVAGWAIERARSAYGFELRGDAAQALADAVGAELSVVDAELSKLAAIAENGTVSRRAVEALVAPVGRVDRWAWLDRVAERDYRGALGQLETLLGADHAVSLLASMVEQHLFLALALEGGQRLVKEVLSEAGKPYLGWKARVYAKQAKKWTRAELDRALHRMERADRRLKTGGTPRAVLEELLLSLAVDRRRAA